MTYAEIRELSLMQINQYSMAGSQIVSSYDNQEDYLLRIPALVNQAMDEIVKVRPLEEAIPIGDLETVEQNGVTLYVMPRDFLELKPSGLLWIHEGRRDNLTTYTMVGTKLFIDLPQEGGQIWLRYRRVPRHLPLRPSDDDELDLDQLAQSAIPSYVGAKLVIEDDSFVYASLYNEWLTKLNGLQRAPRAEYETVQEVYDFSGGY